MADLTPTKPYIKMEVGDVLIGKHFVNYIQWYFPAAVAGDLAEFRDGDTETVKKMVIDGTNFDKPYIVRGEVEDLTLLSLAGGEMYVYLNLILSPHSDQRY